LTPVVVQIVFIRTFLADCFVFVLGTVLNLGMRVFQTLEFRGQDELILANSAFVEVVKLQTVEDRLADAELKCIVLLVSELDFPETLHFVC
jgi:hypothetical protein